MTVVNAPRYLLTQREGARFTFHITQAPRSHWVASVTRSIWDIGRLQPGWDGEAAPPVDPEAIRSLLQLLVEFMQPWMIAPSVVPTFAGGVQAEWHGNGIDLEIEFSPDTPAEVLVCDRDAQDTWEGLLAEGGLGRLVELRPRLADPALLRSAFSVA